MKKPISLTPSRKNPDLHLQNTEKKWQSLFPKTTTILLIIVIPSLHMFWKFVL